MKDYGLDLHCQMILEDYRSNHEFWQGKRVKVIDEVQRWMMDLLLKSNNVSEGARDYFGVIAMIMTMDAQMGTEI